MDEKFCVARTTITFFLGAVDPEMIIIKRLIEDSGHVAVQCLDDKGKPVNTSTAYNTPAACKGIGLPYDDVGRQESVPVPRVVFSVECRPVVDGVLVWIPPANRIDHHNPGDAGYGRRPEDFWLASSLGQVCRVLEIAPTPDLLVVAAADHCLADAYQGKCPGVVYPDVLDYRCNTLASFRGATPEKVKEEIEAALTAIEAAKEDIWGVKMFDAPPPGLQDAACIAGVTYQCRAVGRDGNPIPDKWNFGGTPNPVQARRWMELMELDGYKTYGDPMRGIVGALK